MKCKKCNHQAVKNGVQGNGKQRYYCKVCETSFQKKYSNKACKLNTNQKIINLLKEGVGIRGIARLLSISPVTVLKRIKSISSKINKPQLSFYKEYEMDELCTYISTKSRRIWIAYALKKDDKIVVDFRVGRRTNKTLNGVIQTLMYSFPKRIYTDKLKNYKHLIHPQLHSTKKRGTNHIERKNLSMRTHLKRLSRRTICYSKSLTLLNACLRIYFWA